MLKNSKLKAIIDQAKNSNMPKENIERAIKKGTGELAGENLEEVSYEGFGPGGVALIVDGISDNSNRTLGEIRSIFNQNNGKLAGEGAIRWMFERKGAIVVKPEGKSKEELEMIAIESGADDVKWFGEDLEIYTKPEDFETVKKHIERLFTKKMNWNLMGSEIHIDHKIPLASAKTEEELIKLFHYTNLQPLWKKDNFKKHSKILPIQLILTI